jgi:hypothetical protein
MEAGRLGKVRDKRELSDLKERIAMRTYEVDAHEVADALVRKLRLIRMARLALAGQAGRIRSQDEPRR